MDDFLFSSLSQGSTRPPLRGGLAPPLKNQAPPLKIKGGALGPPLILDMKLLKRKYKVMFFYNLLN